MKIAVMGSGIAGLSAAWALRNTHDVTLFEADARLGGHANTVSIDYDGERLSVDTGFIVFNELNYPHLTAFFDHLGVRTQKADMSFAFSAGAGQEWSSNGLSGLFAWRRNLARFEFLCMLTDILRFSLRARSDLVRNRIGSMPLDEYLAGCRIGEAFRSNYLLPMGSAIWSTPAAKLLQYPAQSFLKFFDNHRLLHLSRPKWRSVAGGSQCYVQCVAADLGQRVRLNCPVLGVTRIYDGVM
ncbi:MAG: FAD-dependent oxidoreductase, partial [Caulobacterales bacterium]